MIIASYSYSIVLTVPSLVFQCLGRNHKLGQSALVLRQLSIVFICCLRVAKLQNGIQLRQAIRLAHNVLRRPWPLIIVAEKRVARARVDVASSFGGRTSLTKFQFSALIAMLWRLFMLNNKGFKLFAQHHRLSIRLRPIPLTTCLRSRYAVLAVSETDHLVTI